MSTVTSLLKSVETMYSTLVTGCVGFLCRSKTEKQRCSFHCLVKIQQLLWRVSPVLLNFCMSSQLLSTSNSPSKVIGTRYFLPSCTSFFALNDIYCKKTVISAQKGLRRADEKKDDFLERSLENSAEKDNKNQCYSETCLQDVLRSEIKHILCTWLFS